MLPSLPDDVTCEILSWLPVKAACRFRSVSKGWHVLISTPPFLAVHKRRADPLLLSVTAERPGRRISSLLRLMDTDGNILRVIEKAGVWTMSYCFNDPMCCVYGIRGHASVIDLATGNMVRISSAEMDNERRFFNLSVGCAVPSHTYKVVSFTGEYGACKVLTLEDGAKWRQVHSPPTPYPGSRINHVGSPVTVNGVMHFLYRVVTPQVDEDHVLPFHLESEKWKASIKGPAKSGEAQRCMVKLGDALCMFQWSSVNEGCLIWALADSTKGVWVKLCTTPMNPSFDSWWPLSIMPDSRKFIFYARDKSTKTDTVQVYDPLTGASTHLTRFASNLLGDFGLCVLHLECFVSPKRLPISAPSMLSRLISSRWLRRLNPISLFCK